MEAAESSRPSSDARTLLGPEGPLAQHFAGYEAREGQLAMADAVSRALDDGRVLLCEAGTGTGKTLAYLVPAILSGKKVIVSTATKALQQQIFDHDLPLVRRALGLDPRAALMKGLGNYLCLRRYEAHRRSPEARGRVLTTIDAWRGETTSGDVAELVGLAEDDPVWREITSSSDTRLGSDCSHYDECFVTRMRREAESARLVVVNHHLFFADLALRGPHPGRVLPDYDAVIFDEAHQLEDVATLFFGTRVSSARVEQVLRDAERAFADPEALDVLSGGARSVALARSDAEALFGELSRRGRREDAERTLERDEWAGALLAAYHALDRSLEAVASVAASARDGLRSRSGRPGGELGERLDVSERRAGELRNQLATIVDGARGAVVSVELGARSVALSSRPVSVAEPLRQRVFEQVPAVVLTSATLATRDSFDYLKSRVGLVEEALPDDELVLPSPCDYATRALLYTPSDLPAPGEASFTEAAATRIRELVELTDGGAFVLTTSLRSMRALHAALSGSLGARQLLLQGAVPKAATITAFKAARNAVLVATASFWEGVDVPGEALRLVVLEKVPFPVPSDPVIRARSLELERAGENAFMKLHVPSAAIALKQGFGRLIRSRSDSGIVALLDERVHRKGYGKRLLASLPPAARANDWNQVREFWERR